MSYFGSSMAGSLGAVNYTGPSYDGGYDVNHDGEHQIAMESMQANYEITRAFAQMASVDYTNRARVQQAVLESYSPYQVEEELRNYDVALEAASTGVIQKIKDFVMKLWGKVKAFFASVARSIDLVFKSGTDFVKKYKEQLKKLKLSGFKETTYNYTLGNLPITKVYGKDSNDGFGHVLTTISSGMNDFAGTKIDRDGSDANKEHWDEVDRKLAEHESQRDQRMEEFRGELISGSTSAETFREDLRKALRGGEKTKKEIHINMSTIISDLEGVNKLNETIKKARTEADNHYNGVIRKLNDAADTIDKNKGKADYQTEAGDRAKYISDEGDTKPASDAYVSRVTRYMRSISSDVTARQAIINSVFTEWNAAITERDKEYKRIIRAALSYKEK